MITNVILLEDRDDKAWNTTQMNLFGGEACGRAYRVVERNMHVRKAHIPVALFLDHHGRHLGDRVVEAPNATICFRVV